MQKARNCGGEHRQDGPPVIVLKGTPDIALRECPESFISEFSRQVISLFHMCHTIVPAQRGPALVLAGPLPSRGGVLDQDNATMEGFGVIRAEIMQAKTGKTGKSGKNN